MIHEKIICTKRSAHYLLEIIHADNLPIEAECGICHDGMIELLLSYSEKDVEIYERLMKETWDESLQPL